LVVVVDGLVVVLVDGGLVVVVVVGTDVAAVVVVDGLVVVLVVGGFVLVVVVVGTDVVVVDGLVVVLVLGGLVVVVVVVATDVLVVVDGLVVVVVVGEQSGVSAVAGAPVTAQAWPDVPSRRPRSRTTKPTTVNPRPIRRIRLGNPWAFVPAVMTLRLSSLVRPRLSGRRETESKVTTPRVVPKDST
jgi:hypothetical protein